jgi:hypothetical protein
MCCQRFAVWRSFEGTVIERYGTIWSGFAKKGQSFSTASQYGKGGKSDSND